MKSKSDIQKIVVALAMFTYPKPGHPGPEATDDEKLKARAVMDVLLWVMDYPNKFHKFAGPTSKLIPINDDELEEAFQEAVKEWENFEADTHAE